MAVHRDQWARHRVAGPARLLVAGLLVASAACSAGATVDDRACEAIDRAYDNLDEGPGSARRGSDLTDWLRSVAEDLYQASEILLPEKPDVAGELTTIAVGLDDLAGRMDQLWRSGGVTPADIEGMVIDAMLTPPVLAARRLDEYVIATCGGWGT